MTAKLGTCQISPEIRQSITGQDHHIICLKFLLFYCCDTLLFAFCFPELNAYTLYILLHISKVPIAIKVIWFYFSLTWLKTEKESLVKISHGTNLFIKITMQKTQIMFRLFKYQHQTKSQTIKWSETICRHHNAKPKWKAKTISFV